MLRNGTIDSRERFFEIDGLKGVGCITIAFIYHYRMFWDAFPRLAAYTGYFAGFVEVFIIISGFLMASNYTKRLGNTTFPAYFKKRYFKLMPLYWVTFFSCMIIRILWYNNGTFNATHLLLDFIGLGRVIQPSYFPMNDPAWTINVLFVCYIIFFLLIKLRNRSTSAYYILLFSILALSLTGIANGVSYPFFDADSTLRGYASFIVGMLLYDVTESLKSQSKGHWCAPITYIFIVLSIMFYVIGGRLGMGNMSINVILLYGPCALLMAMYTPLKWVLSTKIFRFLGKISMSVYMWHYFWLYMMYILGLAPSGKGLAVMFIGTMVTAVLSTYLLEPALNRTVKRIGII